MNCKNIENENRRKKERTMDEEIILIKKYRRKKIIVLMEREVESVEKYLFGLIVWQEKENDTELYTVWR